MLKDKVDVVCYSMHGNGMINFVKELNEKIEQGYRFTIPKVREDLPRLRHGYPKFTMSLPGTEPEEEVVVAEPVDVLAWTADKELVQKAIDKVEELSVKADLVEFNEKELHFDIPEDKKVPTAIKAYLLTQLKSLL